jgi:ubiquinone/menaquinone biosynthesis C-methylase UbiE
MPLLVYGSRCGENICITATTVSMANGTEVAASFQVADALKMPFVENSFDLF